MKIKGNTVGFPNPQPDWDQRDATKADYIKNKIPAYVDENGYTVIEGLRGLVSFSVTKGNTTVTVTTTYDSNETHTDVIALDSNDCPISVTSDGKTIPISWEGFE